MWISDGIFLSWDWIDHKNGELTPPLDRLSTGWLKQPAERSKADGFTLPSASKLSVNFVISAHHRRQKSRGSHHRVGICRSTLTTTPVRHGN